jgi:hypothetical protein
MMYYTVDRIKDKLKFKRLAKLTEE